MAQCSPGIALDQICVMSLLWVWFFVPETTGRSLESMDILFDLPWRQIGRCGKYLAPDGIAHFDENDREKAAAVRQE
ncbi:uncharacterized protein N7479_004640 [Penicillium vulpinum]|uniref:uncharacterized protein n=1 Tax=Penicillium vulpinum TaxID=29845 RepID=UPI0025480CFC|nr:uncharacterized protein N7479_004640 [Penicillium vulpinum]KAJ5964764.1 hypothetical protein N7479_004640 [Penicillium vulpinum]